jgi:flotillin
MNFGVLGGAVGIILIIIVVLVFVAISRYKRCPSNKILVVYGKVGKGRSAKCIHGGGTFVIPVI